MQRVDFEQAILELYFEVGHEHLTPNIVAYCLRIPVRIAERNLDVLASEGVLDLQRDDDGHLFYTLSQPRQLDGDLMMKTAAFRSGQSLDAGELPILRTGEMDVLFDSQDSPVVSEVDVEDDLLWLDDDDAFLVESNDYPLATKDDEGDLQLYREEQSPALAMLLSFMWPGLGQVYNGQIEKGVLMFCISMFLWMAFLGWIMTTVSIIDAGVVANRKNEEREREQNQRKLLTAQ